MALNYCWDYDCPDVVRGLNSLSLSLSFPFFFLPSRCGRPEFTEGKNLVWANGVGKARITAGIVSVLAGVVWGRRIELSLFPCLYGVPLSLWRPIIPVSGTSGTESIGRGPLLMVQCSSVESRETDFAADSPFIFISIFL